MSQHTLQNPFVIKAIAACAGSQTELARRCGGRAVTKAQMRPDLFAGPALIAAQQEAA